MKIIKNYAKFFYDWSDETKTQVTSFWFFLFQTSVLVLHSYIKYSTKNEGKWHKIKKNECSQINFSKKMSQELSLSKFFSTGSKV